MANIKTTPEQWLVAREYYEAGLSLAKIVAKTGISKTQISKRSNLESWEKGSEKERLIQDAVRVSVAKGTLTEQALSIHNEIVDERTKHIQFFNSAAVKNVESAVGKINEETSQLEHKLLAETILKGKEVVLGKNPDTAIQINNGNEGAGYSIASNTDWLGFPVNESFQ
jgi:hypothetical protein